MSKKHTKKTAQFNAGTAPETPETAISAVFGFEDMLGELEAIVAEAEVRLAQEAALA